MNDFDSARTFLSQNLKLCGTPFEGFPLPSEVLELVGPKVEEIFVGLYPHRKWDIRTEFDQLRRFSQLMLYDHQRSVSSTSKKIKNVRDQFHLSLAAEDKLKTVTTVATAAIGATAGGVIGPMAAGVAVDFALNYAAEIATKALFDLGEAAVNVVKEEWERDKKRD